MYRCMYSVGLKLPVTFLTMPNIAQDVGFITWIINKNLKIFKEHFVIFPTAPVATIIMFSL